MGANEEHMKEIREDAQVIPSEIIKETDWYSIVESDWGKVTDIHGKEVDDKCIEIYLLKLGRVIRVWSTGVLVADDYECEQCKEEAKGNE